jgi:hypothetical protein
LRAAVFRNGEIVADVLPKPGAGPVPVKTLACGICGSDLQAREHAHRMVELTLVTAAIGIDGVAAAFADLANPERHTKIIVEPWR